VLYSLLGTLSYFLPFNLSYVTLKSLSEPCSGIMDKINRD
jgi:hypothetical protein